MTISHYLIDTIGIIGTFIGALGLLALSYSALGNAGAGTVRRILVATVAGLMPILLTVWFAFAKSQLHVLFQLHRGDVVTAGIQGAFLFILYYFSSQGPRTASNMSYRHSLRDWCVWWCMVRLHCQQWVWSCTLPLAA